MKLKKQFNYIHMNEIYLYKSNRKNKKYVVKIGNKSINFGDNRYEDYTIHKDNDRKNRYITRHKKNENWTKSGIFTPGWWSYYLLWTENTLNKAIKNIEDKFNVKIINKL